MEIIRPAYYVVYASLRLVNASKIDTKLSGFNKNRDLNGTDELISTRFAEQRHLCSSRFDGAKCTEAMHSYAVICISSRPVPRPCINI